MLRCIELAAKGRGFVAPNPMVGCVIVKDSLIIGEGYHKHYGEAHAEVNAIASVSDKSLLASSTLYVNLEPCAHFGKTPPCADLIIAHSIPNVVVGCVDTFSLVSGKGIQKMHDAGIAVISGVLEAECRELNKHFFTFHEKKRPYIILKWAETADGFTDRLRDNDPALDPLQISSPESKALLHTWRSEEQAILIGTETALLDNPQLTVRSASGKNPLRIALDRNNRIPASHHLKDLSTPTWIISAERRAGSGPMLEYLPLDFSTPAETVRKLLALLYSRTVQSLLVEGGTKLISSFFEAGLWDEARVFISPGQIGSGLKAPDKPEGMYTSRSSGRDELRIYKAPV
jgi:diaminohydroxyphosphoribosylaminopyrimidine deaminase/5-amino-6-(5-phosphoribosylamino)uracil reductase